MRASLAIRVTVLGKFGHHTVASHEGHRWWYWQLWDEQEPSFLLADARGVSILEEEKPGVA